MTTEISEMLQVINIAVSRAARNPDFANRQSVYRDGIIFSLVGERTFAPTKTDTRSERSAAQPQSRVGLSKLGLSCRLRKFCYPATTSNRIAIFLILFM